MIALRTLLPLPRLSHAARLKHSASSSKWLNRQSADHWTRQAKNENYLSRAAYKLKQIQHQYRVFRPGMTVVDLGFAPGSWSQVAYSCVRPYGRVIGVDLLPATPPKGVSSLQGNFLDEELKHRLMEVLNQPGLGAPRPQPLIYAEEIEYETAKQRNQEDYDNFRLASVDMPLSESTPQTVDVVLSDMLANTSGTPLRDHAQSMELCHAALEFASNVLKTGGSFVCKFYTGEDDPQLMARLEKMFKSIKKVKPEACRQESREMYFVAMNKRNSRAKL